MTKRSQLPPPVGPRLRVLLVGLFALFAVLAANSVYLGLVTFFEWLSGDIWQGYVYQYMFLLHLVLGLLIVVPVLVFVGLHLRNVWRRPNRRAIHAGLGLLAALLALLVTGFLLVRFDFFEIRDPAVRQLSYWLHVLTPFVCAWLFILHRLAGPRIRWRGGLKLTSVGLVMALGVGLFHVSEHYEWQRIGSGEPVDFSPALAQTASGDHIPAEELMMDEYCAACHQDAHAQWENSVHHFASFNNPVYRFSVLNTREMLMARDGDVKEARFCAGCHDPVPLFSGAFDDPNFDDVNDPTADAGITCTSCHAITEVNSPRGNADYTLETPRHYPFAFRENEWLQWLNHQLIKANPEHHKQTFLKPVHRSSEFCSTCHKVHLPESLNNYNWLRGQNHYDSFLLSGVSGHGVASFYYPEKAVENCQSCHMPDVVSDDFGARSVPGSDDRVIGDHLFPAANTAIAHLLDLPSSVAEQHQSFLEGTVTVDLFALREGGTADGELIGPIRPERPTLNAGQDYLLEVVLRTVGMGHHFTQGTADSNEVWVEVELLHDGEVIGRSGGMDPSDLSVDPWSHFINAYVLDREGNRIDRRNPEDIFVPLYNNAIPPGAADVAHYRMAVPAGLRGELEIVARVHYRKFDTVMMRQVEGEDFRINDLPVTTLSEDRVTLPVGQDASEAGAEPELPQWRRWNDYGIGLLLKPERRQIRQAEDAFQQVEALGKGLGALNLARVYLKDGRLEQAAQALNRAADHDDPPPSWSTAWFSAQVLRQQGELGAAIETYMDLVETRFAEARARGFDFSRDYRLLNELGLSWLELARGARGADRQARRETMLGRARDWFQSALEEDPENLTAHYNLAQVYDLLGESRRATIHRDLHERYRPDDNARDQAIRAARSRDPAADHAADPVVIWDMHRQGASDYPLSVPEAREKLREEDYVER